jgi:hypothetical protein
MFPSIEDIPPIRPLFHCRRGGLIRNRTTVQEYYTICIQATIFLWLVGFMVFNATFNNISAITWQSVSLVEVIGVPEENY